MMVKSGQNQLFRSRISILGQAPKGSRKNQNPAEAGIVVQIILWIWCISTLRS